MSNFTKCILIVTLCTTAFMNNVCKCFAQADSYDIPTYLNHADTTNRFGIYIEGGITIPYTDVKSPKHASYITGVEASYSLFPFVCLSAGTHTGRLKAGDKGSAANDNMYFENQIFDAVFIAKLFPLKLTGDIKDNIALSYLSSFYIGAGIGMIKSRVSVHRFYPSDFEYIGDYTGKDVVFPLIAGLDVPVIKFSDNHTINVSISYRINFCRTDKLDGYVTPESQNGKDDAYNNLNIGIGYRF